MTMTRWWLDFDADIRYALRAWRRHPAFAAVAIVSLAAGIGLNAAVFGIVNTIFLQSIRGVPDADRVVTVGKRVAFTTFRDVRDNARAMSSTAAWQPLGVDVRFRDITVRRVVPAVSDNYFTVLGVRPARGRFFETASSRRPSPEAAAVLDHEFWAEVLGGDASVIGETIAISGVPATIVGIAPQSFHGFGPVRPPLWISMGMKPAVTSSAPLWEDPRENGWRVFGRLDRGGTVAQANAELQVLAARTPALYPDGPLTASSGGEGRGGPVSAEKQIEFLLVVVLPLVVVGLILWIGCSNVANLLLARATTRRKEMAIRLANGATRSRLIRLLLTESLLLAAGGGLLGVLIATWTLDVVWATLPEFPRLAVELDRNVFVYSAIVCLVATIVFGLAPALHATRIDVAPLLKGDGSGADHMSRTGRLRKFFLVTQFASSVALLVVAGTFVRTVVSTHVGEQSALLDRLTTAYVEAKGTPAARMTYWTSVRDELLRVPAVTSVTLVPSAGNLRLRVVPEGANPTTSGSAIAVQQVDASFFRTLGVVVVSGHDDLEAPSGGVEKVIVNERAARQFWRTTDVTGRRFALGEGIPCEIAGVVRDAGSEPSVFRRLSYDAIASASVVIRTTRPSEDMVETVRALLLRLSPDRAFVRVETYREAGLGGLRRITTLALSIALLALSLATIGLYGSVSFITSQRTREIAIRMAIGAPRVAVLRLLARDGVMVVAVGSIVGLALIGVAFQFMSGMIFANWTLDPLTVIGVLATLSLATLAACYLPGRRALRIEPMDVLRNE